MGRLVGIPPGPIQRTRSERLAEGLKETGPMHLDLRLWRLEGGFILRVAFTFLKLFHSQQSSSLPCIHV